MGWAEDHRNAVADRWGQKFQESDLHPEKFREFMEATMKDYGWSAKDIQKMVERAIYKN